VNITKKTIYVDLVETMYKLGLLTENQRYMVGVQVIFNINECDG
jgi:hypothetical protein